MAAEGRLAVVGCGYWGRNLVRNFHALGALGAVSDADPSISTEMSATYGVPAISWEQALASPDLRAVAIAAPAVQHASLAVEALEAGKDVFVEKPLALTVADAERACEVAARQGRVLMVGHLLQYHSAFLRLRALVADGELGPLQYLYSNRLNLGRFRREENIWWSFAPHDLSMILALVGEEPVDVSAVGSTYLSSGVADVTTTNLRFPGGAAAHVFVSWLHPYKDQKLVVVGERGMAVFDDTAPWDQKLAVYPHQVDWSSGGPEPVRADLHYLPLPPSEPLALECQHFLDCVADRSTPRTDGLEGLRVLRVLDRAQRSMTGGDVRGADGIHPTAVIDAGTQIGVDTKIWHFSHVLAGSTIGERCSVGQNVMIGPNVNVGNDCKIQNNVSLYEGVEIEDDVFLGPSCVFTNVTTPRAFVSRKDEFRSTVVRRGASVGANATIVCGHEVGAYALVAAGAVVTSDVPDHALVMGVPARQTGWVSHVGEVLGPDLVCPRTGRRYALVDSCLTEVEGV